ncbi:MAG TPA: glycoside hydrolase family 3 C-terminal domain-containing protein [bacterium]|nr:glycoside hydrolase family 3 C-terminal domain-containing protein [bacterium]HPN42020.1 glycoside hydrolase family 3 C-terminal domain-containing protein [bacterium]
MKKTWLFLFILLCSVTLWAETLPWQNPMLSSEERAQDLLSRLTLEEKAILMNDISDAIPRLNIKNFNWWSEALHGLANNDSVTVFPQPIGMAASFDDELVFKIFTAASDEVRAKYNEAQRRGLPNRRFLSLSVWTPNINIFRDPRWGRGQETYGEDPYLMTRMGISVVKGLQGPEDSRYKKLLACAKHYAVHSGPEWSRHTLNVNNVDPRDLWETYMPAFKALVQQADVREVMCAYQRLDDEPCCGSTRLLERILREDWGFKYLVVSDCGAISDFYTSHKVSSDQVHAAAKGVLAGTDVECAGPSYKQLPKAVANGLIDEADLDKSIMRILVGRFDLGEMDDNALVPWTKIPKTVINCDAHKKLALDMARETMTLLQNKDNILPLSKSVKKIAVIGPNANEKRLLWGNYNGTPIQTITILAGIETKVPEKKIVYDRACDLVDKTYIESAIGDCSIDGKAGIKATYWNNREYKGEAVTTEQIVNPIQLTTDGQHQFGTGVNLIDFSGLYETVYKAKETGELVFKLEARGRFEFIVNGDTLYKPRRFGFPRVNSITLPVEQGKEYKIEGRFSQIGNWPASLNLNFGKQVPVTFDKLVDKLKGIDVVVYVGGISSQLEGEQMPVELPGFKGGDRTDIELPEIQRECLKALKQAGKKVIFVNCSGSAMGLVPETESCDAILQAWYGGEAGGQAVADVLFGDYNPSGKLPVTFYKDIKQYPDFEDYSMKGRTYRFMDDALFQFGFGLSYTTFAIGEAKLSKTEIKNDESVAITIPVTNTGKRNGTEIVQVYIRQVGDSEGPLKTLRGFKRVDVAAGKTGQTVITLPCTSFEFFDRAANKMVVAAGEYEILYGNSSRDKDLKTTRITIL